MVSERKDIGVDEKGALRKRLLDIRRAIAPADYDRKCARIRQTLLSLPEVRDAPTVLTYVSSRDNEVDTQEVIRHLLDAGRAVLVPVTRPERRLIWCPITSLGDLSPGRFGILEPSPERRQPVAPPTDAPVLVPGIAFTPDGYRIGYGAGYFDRFLACHVGVKVGLAFECQIVDAFPRMAHDIAMDLIATEHRLIRPRTTPIAP